MRKFNSKGLRAKVIGLLAVVALLFSVVPVSASGGDSHFGNRRFFLNRFDDNRIRALRVLDNNDLLLRNLRLDENRIRDLRAIGNNDLLLRNLRFNRLGQTIFPAGFMLARDLRGTPFVIFNNNDRVVRAHISEAELAELSRIRPELVVINMTDDLLAIFPEVRPLGLANPFDLARRIPANVFDFRVDNSGPGSFNSGRGSH